MSIDMILRKILSGSLLNLFRARRTHFPPIPLTFAGGHSEYRRVWESLFTYEVFQILLNSRRSESKDEKPN